MQMNNLLDLGNILDKHSLGCHWRQHSCLECWVHWQWWKFQRSFLGTFIFVEAKSDDQHRDSTNDHQKGGKKNQWELHI